MSRITRISCLLLTLATGLILAVAVFPALASPTDTILYAAPIPTGAGNCSSWTNACTLQTALSNAVSGDQIWAQGGVHKPGAVATDTFLLVSGVALYGGFNGTETALEQRDWETNITVLSGDIDNNDLIDPNGVVTDTDGIVGDNSYHVIGCVQVNENTILDGFTITAGDGAYGGGMGIFYFSSPTLENITFSGNLGIIGGGLFNTDSNSKLINVTFRDNEASQVGGGMVVDDSSPILTNVTFQSNMAWEGGGMYNAYDSNPVLTNVIFYANLALQKGGGMANYENSNPTLTNVIFSENDAAVFRVGNGGGGIFNDHSHPTLINVTFYGNHSFNVGGGIYNANSNPMLINNIFWDNTDDDGNSQIFNGFSTPLILYSDIQESGGSGTGWDTYLGIDGGGNMDADPLFVNPENGDWHLVIDSPAIDAGNNISVTVPIDLDNNPRFVDIPTVPDTGNGTPPIVDMGAYEAFVEYHIYLPLALRNVP